MSGSENTKRPLADWVPPEAPGQQVLDGRFARLEPLSAEAHAALLYRSYEASDSVWDFLPYGPFHSAALYHRWVKEATRGPDPHFHAVFDKEAGAFGGVASYLRIKPKMGSIEIGHINFSPLLQRSRAGTEALIQMIGWAFDAGYRRLEWKCDAANLRSRRAAERLGLSYEGVFRQAAVVKGRNRDTAWFAAVDKEWPALQEAYSAWLAPSNFDASGHQRERLSDLTRLVRVSEDPTLL